MTMRVSQRFVIAVAFCGAFWIAFMGQPVARAVFGIGPLAPDEKSLALDLAEARCIRALTAEIVRATGASGDAAGHAAEDRCDLLFSAAGRDGRGPQFARR